MSLTAQQVADIQQAITMVTQLCAPLTSEGNSTSPLISSSNVNKLNDALSDTLDYLNSITPTIS